MVGRCAEFQGTTSSGEVGIDQGRWRSNDWECRVSRKLRVREHAGVCEKIGGKGREFLILVMSSWTIN